MEDITKYVIGVTGRNCSACNSSSTTDSFNKHINNSDIHVTKEDKDKWNKAAASSDNIDGEIAAKADVSEIPTRVSQLENDRGYMNEVPEEYLTELELKYKNFVRLEDLENILKTNIPSLEGYATLSWIQQQGYLKEHQHIKKISDGTNTYSLIGDGTITIKAAASTGGNTGGGSTTTSDYKLKAATEGELGGIKLGYPLNGKNYPVRLLNDRAYVYVPWVSGTSSQTTDENAGYYEIIFKAEENGVQARLPIDFDSNAEGWEHYALNSDGSKTVWMASRWVDYHGNKGEWQGPWVISGKDGEAGVDGAYYEYVYTRTTDNNTDVIPDVNSKVASSASTGKKASDDDFVPLGWYDNPKGVDSLYKFEWMALRHKTFSSDNVGTWSNFIGPILWSNFGVNGNDGDGVEYIYYATSADDTSKPTGSTYNPKEWYTDEQSKQDVNKKTFNAREYILTKPSGLNSGATWWLDNPIDMAEQGQIEYVSIRKKYADKEGEEPYWHQYSDPAYWASVPMDGKDSAGFTLTFTDDNITVDIDSEGHASTDINVSTILTGKYGNESVLINSISCDIARTDGKSSGFTTVVDPSFIDVKYNGSSVGKFEESNLKEYVTCKLNIPVSTKLDLTSPIIFTVKVSGTSKNTNVSVEGSKSFRITGIQFGADGVSYNLVTGVSSISKKFNALSSNWYYPVNKIYPKIVKTTLTGTEDVDFLRDNRFDIKYSIDGNTEYTLNAGTMDSDIVESMKLFITISAYYNDHLFDSLTIFLVQDGAPGEGGNSPIYYQVNPLSSSVVSEYKTNQFYMNGTVLFEVIRVKDGSVTYESDQSAIEVTPSGELSSTQQNYGHTVFVVKYTDKTPSNSIQIRYKEGDYILASAAVPVPKNGKNGLDGQAGLAGTLTLVKSSLRFRGEYNPGDTYYDGVTTAIDNTYYLDYCTYENVYYVCTKEVNDASSTPEVDTTHWTPLSPSNSLFAELLVANKAKIGELSVNEVVLYDTKPDGSDGTIQAGMTSGYSIDGSPIDNNKKNGIRFWAGATTNGNLATAPFTVNSEGKLHASNIEATGGTIGGLLLHDKYIGTELANVGLGLSDTIMKVNDNGTYRAAFGVNVASSIFDWTSAGIIENHSREFGKFTNYGINIHVDGAEHNYGVYSNAPVRASSVYGDKITTVSFGSGTNERFDLSKNNVILIKNLESTGVNLHLPTEYDIESLFGYTSLPLDFGVIFYIICVHAPSGREIVIKDIYGGNNEKRDLSMASGDCAMFLAYNNGGITYKLLNLVQ